MLSISFYLCQTVGIISTLIICRSSLNLWRSWSVVRPRSYRVIWVWCYVPTQSYFVLFALSLNNKSIWISLEIVTLFFIEAQCSQSEVLWYGSFGCESTTGCLHCSLSSDPSQSVSHFVECLAVSIVYLSLHLLNQYPLIKCHAVSVGSNGVISTVKSDELQILSLFGVIWWHSVGATAHNHRFGD